jgi:hypothetical protein
LKFAFARAFQNSLCLLDIGSSSPFAKLIVSPQSRQLFRYRHVDQLVQRDAFGFGNAPSFVQQRRLKSERYITSSQ